MEGSTSNSRALGRKALAVLMSVVLAFGLNPVAKMPRAYADGGVQAASTNSIKAQATENVATLYPKAGGETRSFTSVSSAVAASAAGDSVELLMDVEEDVAVGEGKDVVIELNGHTLTGTVNVAATGSVRFTDKSEKQEGTVAAPDKAAAFSIAEGGSATIAAGTFDASAAAGATSIVGGYVKGAIDEKAANAKLAISGGKFTDRPADKYLFAGTGEQDDALAAVNKDDDPASDYKYKVVARSAVKASVTAPAAEAAEGAEAVQPQPDYYESFDDAFAAAITANDGSTVQLMADCESTYKTVRDSVSVAIDLNGHTWTNSGDKYGLLFVYGGSVVVKDTSEAANGKVLSGVKESSVLQASRNGKLKLEGGTVEYAGEDSSKSAVQVGSTASGGTAGYFEMIGGSIVSTGYGVYGLKNSTVKVSGGNISAPDAVALSGNGTDGLGGTDFEVSGGTLSGGDAGVYYPQGGTLKITGTADITGIYGPGVAMRAGSLVMDGGKVATTATDPHKVGDGSNLLPVSAIAVDREASYPGLNGEDTAKISGGKLLAPQGKPVLSSLLGDGQKDIYQVSGGVFSAEPAKGYLAEGFSVVENPGADADVYPYTVDSVAMIGAGEGATYYATLQDAVNAAKATSENLVVKLRLDTAEDIVVAQGAKVTIDLAGKKLTNKAGDTIYVEKGAELTVTDTSEGKTGAVDNVTHGKAAVFNNGTANLNGGSFARSAENGQDKEDAGGNSYYNVLNHGTMTIDGAKVSQGGHFSSMIANGYYAYKAGEGETPNERVNYVSEKGAEKPSLTIKSGTFSGGLNTIKNDDNATLAIEGGEFTNMTQFVVMNNNEATISGGTFEQADGATSAVLMNVAAKSDVNKGNLTISGGEFKAGAGNLIATGGDLESAVSGKGAIVITGGKFNGELPATTTLKAGHKIAISNEDPTKGALAFTSAVPQEYCAANYLPAKNTLDTTYQYTVKPSIANATVTVPELTYTGAAQTPTVKEVKLDSKAIDSYYYDVKFFATNTDGVLSDEVATVTKAGTYYARVTADDAAPYAGEKVQQFDVAKADVSNVAVKFADSADAEEWSDTWTGAYTGNDVKPAVKVMLGEVALTDADYSIEWPADMVSLGEKTLKVSAKADGSLSGASKDAKYTVGGISIADAKVAQPEDGVYSGSAYKPAPQVTLGTTALTEDDYTLKYYTTEEVNDDSEGAEEGAKKTVKKDEISEPKDVGTYAVVAEGKGNYAGETAPAFFEIAKSTLEGYSLSMSATEGTYGSVAEPVVKLVKGEGTGAVEAGASLYKVTYSYTEGEGESATTTEVADIAKADARAYDVAVEPAGDDVAKNYDFKFTGTFTVNAASIVGAQVAFAGPYTYTGEEQALVPTVKIGEGSSTTLGAGDYTVAFYADEACTEAKAVKDAGDYYALVTGKGNYTGSADAVKISVGKASLSGATVMFLDKATGQYVEKWTGGYTKSAVEADGIKVKLGGVLLDDELGTLEYSNNVYPGTDTATVKVNAAATGNLEGSTSAKFSIYGNVVNEVSLEASEFTYDGKSAEVKVASVKGLDGAVVAEGNYTVTYAKENGEALSNPATAPTDAGKYLAVVSGTGTFAGSASAAFEIKPFDLNGAAFELDELTSTTYDGADKKPGVKSLKFSSAEDAASIVAGDYKVTYDEDCKSAGEHTVTVSSADNKGNLTGSVTAKYTVAKADLSKTETKLAVKLADAGTADDDTGAWVEPSNYKPVYTGSKIKPAVKATALGNDSSAVALAAGTDYSVVYLDNKDAGQGGVTLFGSGNYTGAETFNFTIGAKALESSMIQVEDQAYSGNALEPASVVFNDTVLEAGVDYVANYENNVKPGTATVSVSAQGGNFSGFASKDFKITATDSQMTLNGKPAAVLTYDADNPQVVNASDAFELEGSFGTVTYAVDENAANIAIGASTGDLTVPAGTEAGSYTVDVTATASDPDAGVQPAKATGTVTIVVVKADNPLVVAATGGNTVELTYNAADDQTVAAEGAGFTVKSAAGDKLEYAKTMGPDSITVDDTTGTVTALAGLPAGSYYVGVAVFAEGVDGCYESGMATLSYRVKVAKADIAPTVAIDGWAYGKEANEPVVEGNPGNGKAKFEYKGSDEGAPYSETVPTEVGDYTVRVTIPATANYNGGTAEKTFSISKANIDPKVSIAGWTYGATASTPSVDGNAGGGDVTYAYKAKGADDTAYAAAQPTDAGDYTVRATVAETASYNGGSATADFTIAKAASKVTVADKTVTFNGKAVASSEAVKTGSEGAVTYAYFSDAKCTKSVIAANVKNAGTYYVKATVAADANHEAATSAAAKITINKAANKLTLTAKTSKKKPLAAKAAKATTFTVAKYVTVKNPTKGTLTYAKSSGDGKIKVDKKTGKLTVSKGLKKGKTYTVKVKVTSAASTNYQAANKTVTLYVKVK